MFATLKKPALLQVYLMHLFALMASSMTQSIFILYAIELKADVLTINLTTTIASALTILLEVPFGILSDRFGRKPMLIYARLVIIVGTLVRVVATEPSHLLVGAFLGGLQGGEFLPTLLTMVSDVSKPAERKEALSTVFIFSGIGMLVSPIISSSLLLIPQISLRNIYQISLVAETILLLYIIIGVHETKLKTPEGAKINYRLFLSDLIRQRSYQALLIMSFMVAFARSSMSTYLQIYAKETLKLSNAEVSSFTVFNNVSSLGTRLLSTTLLRKLGFKPFIVSALILNGAANLMAVTANNYTLLILIFLLIGISIGAMRSLESIWVADNSTSADRGVANSTHTAAASSGNIMKLVTSPMANASAISGDFSFLFILSGVLCLIATVPPLLFYKPSTEK